MKATSLEIRGHKLAWGSRTFIMGILNLTPDSFSGDGLLSGSSQPAAQDAGVSSALEQASLFLSAGADILDVGGESTRPDASPVSAEEERQRVVPVIQALRAGLDVLISIDTYKASVAEAALQAGADIVNDVWGLLADPEMAATAARHHAPVILMHNRSSWAPAEIQARPGVRAGQPYEDLLEDVRRELLESAALAREAGIPEEHILLDPGIGFGKTVEQNLELIDRLDEVRALGYPVLLGPSRKSFIGRILDLPAGQRLEGTAAAVAIGIARGADLMRVHDVAAMARAARLADAIVRPRMRGM